MDSQNRIIDGQGFVFLPKNITYDNSAVTTKEIYDMKAAGLHPIVKINGMGGHVLGAYSIIDAIKTTEADTHITGLAASVHGIIAQHGKNRIADSHAIGMFHPPAGGEAIIELVRDGLKDQLSGRSKLSGDQIDKIMNSGSKNRFMKASEMKEFSLVDEVIPSHQIVDLPENATKEELFNIYNKLITNDEQMNDLDITNELNSLRKEKEKISSQVTDLETKNSAITEELETVKAENKTLCEEIAVVNKAKAELLVKNAVEANKIKKEDSEKWVKNATENYDMVNDLLEGIQVSNDIVVEDLLDSGGASEVKTFNTMSDDEQADLARSNPELYNKEILNEK